MFFSRDYKNQIIPFQLLIINSSTFETLQLIVLAEMERYRTQKEGTCSLREINIFKSYFRNVCYLRKSTCLYSSDPPYNISS